MLLNITSVTAENIDFDDKEISKSNISINKQIKYSVNKTNNLLSNPVNSNNEISQNLTNRINNANDNDIIIIDPGNYKIHNITINKNITLQGNGDPRNVILDGEQISSIFLIHNSSVTARFNNLTFINGKTDNFGGAICVETGNTYVDNCIFINNTALSDTNGGAISNYGNEEYRSYLFVNNSLFLGNHADHDGGAITTCYASSDIYNTMFINNSAHRDGGAIRVSVFGYGNVQDCIFIYNHADEWGGAYYSWAGNSSIDRCIFLNNTAGTNGGAIMVSGSLNLTNSLIINNTANETGGSFYIQQPMFDALTIIKVENNIITNNSAPLGQEIFVRWNDTKNLFPKFNNNNWGDEDPTNPKVIDPNNVSDRIRPTISNQNYDLLYKLNFGLLNRYYDILDDYYAGFSENFNANIKSNDSSFNNKTDLKFNTNYSKIKLNNKSDNTTKIKLNNNLNKDTINSDNTTKIKLNNDLNNDIFNKNNTMKKSNTSPNEKFNSTTGSYGPTNKKVVEVFKDAKKNNSSLNSFDVKYIAGLIIIFLIILIGFVKRKSTDN